MIEREEKRNLARERPNPSLFKVVTTGSNGSIHFFMSSLNPQTNPSPPYSHKQPSGTSVALVCVFFSCFIAIVYLSAKAPRPSPQVLASSTARRLVAWRRRPRLFEIWLDKHLEGTVHNWRVSHPVDSPTQLSLTSRPPARTHTTFPTNRFAPPSPLPRGTTMAK